MAAGLEIRTTVENPEIMIMVSQGVMTTALAIGTHLKKDVVTMIPKNVIHILIAL